MKTLNYNTRETVPGEEWRPVPGYEGKYDISSLGRVRSYYAAVGRPNRGRAVVSSPQDFLNPVVAHNGYWRVTLANRLPRAVHRLMMHAFVGPIPDGRIVRHLDGNPANNVLSNLCYGTPSENARDRNRHRIVGKPHYEVRWLLPGRTSGRALMRINLLRPTNERWRPVVGYEGLYDVSDRGRIRSYWSSGPRSEAKVHKNTSHIMSVKKLRCGYPSVRLQRLDGSRTFRDVHSLIMRAFVGTRPRGQQVRHLNGVRMDNRLENLRYGTPSENQMDRVLHGTSNRGERCGAAKLDEGSVKAIRAGVAAGTKQVHYVRLYGVYPTTISCIVNRKTWRHVP